jgi:NADH-quinone oxidoreductase subunit L
MSTLTPLMLFLPLAGFAILGVAGRVLPRPVTAVIGCGTVFVAFIIACTNFFAVQTDSTVHIITLWRWIDAGTLHIDLGLAVDRLSTIMMLVVTGVGFLIHVYSIGYMADDPNYGRFFSFMNLFIFTMSLLVLADNFLFLLVGWGGVGLASFLLIGFWYQRPSAVAAAMKAFVVNVIGDFGMMIAIFLLFTKIGSLSYSDILFGNTGPAHFTANDQTTTAIALMLLIAAAAKSAQLPLHVWLPDAMEGPTPVSALIHAATMVTAGVYLVARTHIIFEQAPIATMLIAIMGGASALYAASTALFQYDIKRVLAYSTMSQLGYMFMAESVGANTAAIFHLTTHAFFKALLFMAAGGVIHALGGEQDLRKMGGLREKLPITFWSFVIGGIALAGIPPFAGFWSKDDILGAIYQKATLESSSGLYLLWAAGLLTAILTGFYTVRLIGSIFFGQYRGTIAAEQSNVRQAHSAHTGIHEVGLAMSAPMVILLGLSVIGGFTGIPGHDAIGDFLAPAVGEPLSASGGTLAIALIVGIIAALVGVGLAWPRYVRPKLTFTINRALPYQILAHAYYIDAIYAAVIVQPILGIGRALNTALEGWVLDGGARGIAYLVGNASRGVRRLESGYVRNYALSIFSGALLIILFIVYQMNK